MEVSHFVFAEQSQPLYLEYSSVQPIISPADVWLTAQRNPTDATARGVVNPTQELPAQNCPLILDEKQFDEKLKRLFVPLPNSINTPVNVDNLMAELQDYPFHDIKHYLLTSFRSGFRLGYTGPRFSILLKNLKSALDNPTEVSKAIAKELERKHIAGPFKVPPIHPLHCSHLGAVPEKDKSWRLILDLS